MASGSFNITTDNTYISGKVSWSSVKDTVTNTSDVTVTMYLSRTNTGYTTSGSGTFNVVVNGTTVSDSGSYTITYNSNTVMVTGTVYNIPHNSDGSKSITISWSGSLSSPFSVNGGSGTAVLDKIPRESTLTGGMNWTAGNAVTFAITRADATFKHDIKVEVQSNGSTYVFLNGGNPVLSNIGTSGTWTPSATDMTTIFDYCNNDTTSWNQGTRISLITKDASGNVIGTNTYTGTVSSPVASTTTYTPNFNIGDTLSIPITRALTSLVHKVQIYVNNVLIHTSPTSTLTTTYTWVPSAGEKTAMYNANTTTTSSASRIDITTYYDSSTTDQIVRTATSKSGTAMVTNSLPVFTTATYTDYNSATLAITSPYQGGNTPYIIQNASKLRAEVTLANKAVEQNGATITQYIATVNGETVVKVSPFTFPLQFDFDTINANANQNLVITAYDSRGFFKQVTLVVNVVPWTPPIVNSTAVRDYGFLANTPLTLAGTISPCNVNGTNVNSLVPASVTYKTRIKGGSYGAATQFLGQTLTLPSYTATTVNLTLTTTSAYDIEVIVTDKFGSTTKTISVGTGVPILFIDDALKSIGIGKFPSVANSIETDNVIYNNRVLIEDAGGTGDLDNLGGVFKAIRTTNTTLNRPRDYCSVINFPFSVNSDFQIGSYYGGGNIFYVRGRKDIGAVWQPWEQLSTFTTGSSANGEWVRFNDGTQICWFNGSTTGTSIAAAYGSLFQGARTWTFPATFLDNPTVLCGQFKWGTGASWGMVSTITTTSALINVLDVASRATGTTVSLMHMAIGRWK